MVNGQGAAQPKLAFSEHASVAAEGSHMVLEEGSGRRSQRNVGLVQSTSPKAPQNFGVRDVRFLGWARRACA